MRTLIVNSDGYGYSPQVNDLDRLRNLRKMLLNGTPLSDFEQALISGS